MSTDIGTNSLARARDIYKFLLMKKKRVDADEIARVFYERKRKRRYKHRFESPEIVSQSFSESVYAIGIRCGHCIVYYRLYSSDETKTKHNSK